MIVLNWIEKSYVDRCLIETELEIEMVTGRLVTLLSQLPHFNSHSVVVVHQVMNVYCLAGGRTFLDTHLFQRKVILFLCLSFSVFLFSLQKGIKESIVK